MALPTTFPQPSLVAGGKIPTPVAEVLAARGRRAEAATHTEVRIKWFIEEVSNKIAMTMRQRMDIVTHILKDRVVRNISVPVVKGTGPRGGRVALGRSLPGEYPRADTKQLMRTIFKEVREVVPGAYEGYVGTPLDYGLILETRMGRKFLLASLYESFNDIKRILSGPIE